MGQSICNFWGNLFMIFGIKKAAKHLGECFAAGVMALFLGGMFAYLPSLAWIALLSAS